MDSGSRPTTAEISLENLRFNLRSAREFIGNGLKVMSVVKADAYGHGAVECSRALVSEGTDWLSVTTPEEGIELRSASISTPILVLGGFWPGQEQVVLEYELTPVIFEMERAKSLNEAARRSGQKAAVHLKFETGMHRLGFAWNEAAETARQLLPLESLSIEGLMTHFASADDLGESVFTRTQVERFHEARSVLEEAGISPEHIDLSNSPGAVVLGGNGGNMVRLGGILYGLGGDVLPREADKPELRPVMSLTSAVSQIRAVAAGETIGYGRTFSLERDSIIAALPIGYHDGYRRAFSNCASVIIRGCPAPVVGRISMDWTLIDVTDIPGVTLGDDAVIIGESDGLSVKAEDLARLAGTISYEITCGISRRVPRKFIGI